MFLLAASAAETASANAAADSKAAADANKAAAAAKAVKIHDFCCAKAVHPAKLRLTHGNVL